MRGKVTCELRSAVLLVDTSRVTPERPRRLGVEHTEAVAEVEVEAGLGDVLRIGSRGETDDLGPI